MRARTSQLRSTIRALPTLFRVGVAETVAYRAEMFVWILTLTMPLVMLGLWTSVASEAPFRGYASSDFVAYYLLALIVRNVTSSWVVWQINEDVRLGFLSMRLLRPIHPFVMYVAQHLSAVPLRAIIAIPVAVILLFTSARDAITSDPARIALFVVSLALAWAIVFAVQLAIGSLAFWFTRSMAVLDVYFGMFAVLSGYLLPLALLPDWIGAAADYTPFPGMLSVPIDVMIARDLDAAGAAALVGGQAAWAAIMIAIAMIAWRAGVRRYEAVGA
jgi:ABC-2 type transport system permease protein